jgi:protein LSM12 homolog
MSEDAEFMFTPGSMVSIETCHDNCFEGEVIAFDYHKRVLLLKCSASSGQPAMSDVHLINLSNVKDVKIKKEVKKEDVNSSTPLHLNLNKVRYLLPLFFFQISNKKLNSYQHLLSLLHNKRFSKEQMQQLSKENA